MILGEWEIVIVPPLEPYYNVPIVPELVASSIINEPDWSNIPEITHCQIDAPEGEWCFHQCSRHKLILFQPAGI